MYCNCGYNINTAIELHNYIHVYIHHSQSAPMFVYSMLSLIGNIYTSTHYTVSGLCLHAPFLTSWKAELVGFRDHS